MSAVSDNKKDKMNQQFKELLLETLQEVKKHPDGKEGVAFVTEFEEEPEWEFALVFRKKEVENTTKH